MTIFVSPQRFSFLFGTGSHYVALTGLELTYVDQVGRQTPRDHPGSAQIFSAHWFNICLWALTEKCIAI